MKKVTTIFMILLLSFCFAGCASWSAQAVESETANTAETEKEAESESMQTRAGNFDKESLIADVINDPTFGDYGRLIFPVDTGYYSGDTLESLSLVWYNSISPDKTVEIVNYLKNQADAGENVFYDIYTEEEKAADPDKEDTGLFFFKGNPGEKFAVCNAGGGFAYVGAMQDSFPHALEVSKKGCQIIKCVIVVYSAFALQKRSILKYALLKEQFVFFDFAEPYILFLLDYIAIMGLLMLVADLFASKLKKSGK